MAGFDYSGLKGTAERLLARFGKPAAIRRTTTTGGDPWDPTQSTTDHACTVVVTKYSFMERQSSLIQETDRKALISTEGLSITPTNADLLVIDGTAYEIVSIDPLEPGDTTLLWSAQVRF